MCVAGRQARACTKEKMEKYDGPLQQTTTQIWHNYGIALECLDFRFLTMGKANQDRHEAFKMYNRYL